jgi:hypothetical protein
MRRTKFPIKLTFLFLQVHASSERTQAERLGAPVIWQALSTFLYGAFIGAVLGAGILASTFAFNGPGGRGWTDYWHKLRGRSSSSKPPH